MAKKNATAQVEAAAQVDAPEVAHTAAEAATPEVTEATAEAATTLQLDGQPTQAAKRERNYSQTAIDKEDLDRLNAFKAHAKDNIGVVVSNQRIIKAALNVLAENVEPFLKELTQEAHEKKRQKNLAAYEALKAQLEADGLLGDQAETPAEAEAAAE